MATTLTEQQKKDIRAGYAAREKASYAAKQTATPAVVKPSPTSVTGVPKTNANNNISGSTPNITNTLTKPTPYIANTLTKPTPYIANTLTKPTPLAAPSTVSSPPSTSYPNGSPPVAPSSGLPANFSTATNQPKVEAGVEEIPTKTATNLPSSTAGATGTTGTTAPGTPSTTGATPVGATADTSIQDMKAAGAEAVAGLNEIKTNLEQWKAEDAASIEREYQARQAELERSLNVLQTLHEQNLNALDSATAASQAANDAALKKMEANTKLAQQRVDQKYLELQAAQKLENKRMEIKKETALGVLGGSFTSAGAADIEDTIMQGDKALNSLGLSNISQDVQFTNDLNSFYDDYRTKNLEIQSYKMSKINESYANLQNSIASIQSSKTMSEVEKEQAIRASGQNYNAQITEINKQVVQAKYDLSLNVQARADSLKAQAEATAKAQTDEANKVRDDARATLTTLVNTYGSAAFTNLSAADQLSVKDLAEKAGWPLDKITSGEATMKEELNDAKINQMNITNDQKQQLIDLKAKLGTKITQSTNADGTVSIIYSDPITKKSVVFNAGDIGKPDFKYQAVQNVDGSWSMADKQAGTISNAGALEGAGRKGTPQDALNIPVNNKGVGGQGGSCGRFVNDYSGAGMPDLYTDKIAKKNSDTPSVGAIFIMPTGNQWGHTGFVKEIGINPRTGNPGILAKDSNWGEEQTKGGAGPGLIREHWIDKSAIKGYITTSSTPTSQTSTTPKVNTGIPILDNLLNNLPKGVSGMTRQEKINALVTAQSEAAGKVVGIDKLGNAAINKMSDKELTDLVTKLKATTQTNVQTDQANLKKKQEDLTSSDLAEGWD